MEAACLKVISWLERSGYMPENAAYDIECASENVEDSIKDFVEAAARLSETDYDEPLMFAERVAKMGVLAQRLRNDIQDIEDALGKTLIALPKSSFDAEPATEEGP